MRSRNSGPATQEFLSQEDLLASVYNLHEITLALAIGILCWAWEHGPIGARERFRVSWLAS
jgi:hypothetical protein